MTRHVTADGIVLQVRKPGPSDQAYVASTWVHSLRNLPRAERPTDHEANALVDRLLDEESVRIELAVDPVSERTIIGWIAYTKLRGRVIVHFAYVRDKMRKRGVLNAMLRHVVDTHGRLGERTQLLFTVRGPMTDAVLATYGDPPRYMPIAEFLA